MNLGDIRACFEGAIPAVIATAASDGTPNITYLSRVRLVDDHRIALSNQFFSKTTRNLAENPRASVLLVDPIQYRQYQLTLVYERTERRGPVFDKLREDVDALAVLQRMEGVFKLRAADIYRVTELVDLTPSRHAEDPSHVWGGEVLPADRLAELSTRLSRCQDLDAVVSATVNGVVDVLGYEHCLLLLLDESGTTMFTIASVGYDAEGIGSEVPVGEGIIGMAAARGIPIRLGNLLHMERYSRTVRRSYEDSGDIGPAHEIPVPGLGVVESRMAVPALSLGQLVGVIVVDSEERVAFTDTDEAVLTVVASVVANAVENARSQERDDEAVRASVEHEPTAATDAPLTRVRYFAVDGSTFLDGEYLIKGVAGRILWALLGHHVNDGRSEFTNREVRLDPSLELPEFRDNLESRLILLKRRLDERDAPIRIEKTGRGRFRLEVDGELRLEAAG